MGQISLLAIIPERQFAIAILTNANKGGAITDEVRRWALKAYLELKQPRPKPIKTTSKELAAYTGFYTRPFADAELGILGGRLIAQITYKKGFPAEDSPPPPPLPPGAFTLCGKDQLLGLDGPAKDAVIDVIRKQDGSIGWLRMGRLYRRVE